MKFDKVLNIPSEIERVKIKRLAREYRSKGFEVEIEPRVAVLGDYIPDLIVKKGGNVIVIEVKTTMNLNKSKGLDDIIELVKSQGWEFDLVITNPKKKKTSEAPKQQLNIAEVKEQIKIAKKLIKNRQIANAIIILWPGLEVILRDVLKMEKLGHKYQSSALMKEAYTYGVIDKKTFETLLKVLSYRNEIAHGYKVKKLVESVANNLIFIIEDFINYKIYTKDAMCDWFFDNYEDPANGVPYESGEGGYQYVLGGPYDAEEALRDQFPNAEYKNIREAVESIQNYGWEWVKIGQY